MARQSIQRVLFIGHIWSQRIGIFEEEFGSSTEPGPNVCSESANGCGVAHKVIVSCSLRKLTQENQFSIDNTFGFFSRFLVSTYIIMYFVFLLSYFSISSVFLFFLSYFFIENKDNNIIN